MYERKPDAAMRIRHAAVWGVVACGWKGDVRNEHVSESLTIVVPGMVCELLEALQGFMFVESHCMKGKNDARLA